MLANALPRGAVAPFRPDAACRTRFSGDSRLIESASSVGMGNKAFLTEGDGFVKLPGIDTGELYNFLVTPGPYHGLCILGEPGSGKSTLAHRLVSQLKREGYSVFTCENSRQHGQPYFDGDAMDRFEAQVAASERRHPGRPVFLCLDELQFAVYRHWDEVGSRRGQADTMVRRLRELVSRHPQVKLLATGLTPSHARSWLAEANVAEPVRDDFAAYLGEMPAISMKRLKVPSGGELAAPLMASVNHVLKSSGFKPMPEDFQRRLLRENAMLNPRLLLYAIADAIRNAWPGGRRESTPEDVEAVPSEVWDRVAENYASSND